MKQAFQKGVFNLLNGDGAGVGTQLSGHPDIDMISFTGSTRAGKLISKNAADTIKKVCLELGGKGANIVFADADEKAIKRGSTNEFLIIQDKAVMHQHVYWLNSLYMTKL